MDFCRCIMAFHSKVFFSSHKSKQETLVVLLILMKSFHCISKFCKKYSSANKVKLNSCRSDVGSKQGKSVSGYKKTQ